MKKVLFFLISLLVFIPVTNALEKVDLYLFYSELCSTCALEEDWLEEYNKDSKVNIIMLEVTKNSENAKLLNDVRTALKNKELTTPYTVIGTMGMTGFNETIKNNIMKAVEKYSSEEHIDIVPVIKNNLEIDYKIDYPDGEFSIPILGSVDASSVSLPLLSIIIGFVDGFNPCAMWVLLFIISMLFNMKNRRRMWAIGITFLVTSALIYLCFMLAWLQVAISLTSIGWVRLIIALIAMIGGTFNLLSYYKERKKDSGCEIIDDKKRKSMFKKIKQIITEADKGSKWSFPLALIGIVGLAVSVNLIELACSSGLPLVFTQILALNDLSSLQYFSYILLYILFFLIDDVVIFIIAMKTLKLTGISTKYNKLSHLIGGIVMIIIALLMAFKPEWLMFNF